MHALAGPSRENDDVHEKQNEFRMMRYVSTAGPGRQGLPAEKGVI
jgi:hypothetical protein